LMVNGVRIHLHFLDAFRELPEGGTVPLVKVYCQGCRKYKVVSRVGLRHMGGGVVALQSNCHECRGVMNARKAEEDGRRATR